MSRAVAVNGGGFADTHNQRILIDPGASATTAQAVADAVLNRTGGGTVRIGDVADVADTAAPRFGDALVMGRPGVLLTVSSHYGANTLDATAAVEQALNELKPSLAARGVALYPALHRPANFIESALLGIARDLVVGALMIAAVLFAFMRRWKVVLIAFLSIPLSLVVALLVLAFGGLRPALLVLAGLPLAMAGGVAAVALAGGVVSLALETGQSGREIQGPMALVILGGLLSSLLLTLLLLPALVWRWRRQAA